MKKTVTLAQGILEGTARDGYCVFYDIPYAQPPKPWEGVRNAERARVRCYQGRKPQKTAAVENVVQRPGVVDYQKEFNSYPQFPPAQESEDALVLNIWTPSTQSDTPYPVAVWIHGGAFLNGSGNEVEFDGESYAKQGVILVTVNYRLGLLGFFCHPDLIEEQGFCGNYGLLDQAAALRWVQENIAAFGGDPSRVTLFGQSAGCISTIHQICAPHGRNLFQQAILQSGTSMELMRGARYTQQEAAQCGKDFGRTYFGMDSVKHLRTLSPQQLTQALAEQLQKMGVGLGKVPFTAPVMDSCYFTQSPADLIGSGTIRQLPTMVGSTSEDIYADSMRQGCRVWAEAMGGENCYVYYFAHQLLGDCAGAFHSSELWYMFETLGRSWRPKTEADYRLSKEMVRRWCAFIKTGSPNDTGLPSWKPYDKEADNEYRFD